MPISNERRYYLTLPDERYKRRLKIRAAKCDQSMSEYIVARLNTLDAIEADLGEAFIDKFNGDK